MLFKSLCDTFEAIKIVVLVSGKLNILEDFFQNVREVLQIKESTDASKFFDVLRLVLPKFDSFRESYNMRAKSLIKLIAEILQIPEGSSRDCMSKYDSLEHLGMMIESVVRRYFAVRDYSLTISEVNNYLDELSRTSVHGEMKNILRNIFSRAGPLEIKWIVQIILKDVRLGLSKDQIFNCYHKDAFSLYLTNRSMLTVCENLWNPSIVFCQGQVILFRPFVPMLCARSGLRSFENDFGEGVPMSVEEKFDGERFQIHMQNGNFMYFSRNGHDYTNSYGANYHDNSSFTAKLRNAFDSEVTSFIMDGEMMLWDKEDHYFGSKAYPIDVKSITHKSYQPCFCAFDLLFFNGEDISAHPLTTRTRLLRDCVRDDIPGVILVSPVTKIQTLQDVVNAMNICVENNDEGIVIKKLDTRYQYGSRNGGWFKLKVEYIEGNASDLDLVVMGCLVINQEITSYIVGILTDTTDCNLVSFAKVSLGLNDDKSKSIQMHFDRKGQLFLDSNRALHEGKLSFGSCFPNLWLKPEDRLVFTVRSTELVQCNDNKYLTPFTLRFPRITDVRKDKPIRDCLTSIQLRELTLNKGPVIKLNTKKLTLEDIEEAARKPKRIKTVQVVDNEALARTTGLLEGYRIFVHRGGMILSKTDIEACISRNGGLPIWNYKDVKIILTVDTEPSDYYEFEKYKAANPIANIVGVKWLSRVVAANLLLCHDYDEIIHIGYELDNELTVNLDHFGDSHTSGVSNDTLEELLERIHQSNNSSNDMSDEPLVSKMEVCESTPPVDMITDHNYARTEKYDHLSEAEDDDVLPKYTYMHAYFDKYVVFNNAESDCIYESCRDEVVFRNHGGIVDDIISPEVDLIVLETGDEVREMLLLEFLRVNNFEGIRIITKDIMYQYLRK